MTSVMPLPLRPEDEAELLWKWIQNGETFRSFHEEEIKTWQEQQEANSMDDIFNLENVSRTEQLFIS